MAETASNILPISLKTLHKVMKHAPAKYLNPLNAAMAIYHINSSKRVAAFVSQVAVESNELRHHHELWTSHKDFKLAGVARKAHTATSKEDYFNYWYGNRDALGNTAANDGFNYRGRGAIQITGKSNYEKIGAGIGKPLKDNPDLLETDAAVDMLASAYFFAKLKHLNHVADSVDPKHEHSIKVVNSTLTIAVNGGYNGLHERLNYYKAALVSLRA